VTQNASRLVSLDPARTDLGVADRRLSSSVGKLRVRSRARLRISLKFAGRAGEHDGFGAGRGVGVDDPFAAATATAEEGGLVRILDLAGSGDRIRAADPRAIQHMAVTAAGRIRGG